MTRIHEHWERVKCPDCNFGWTPAGVLGPDECARCNGSGFIAVYVGNRPAAIRKLMESSDGE